MSFLPIRRGYSFDKDEQSKLTQAKKLEKNKIVSLMQTSFTHCKQCGNEVEIDEQFRKLKKATCSHCDKMVGLPTKAREKVVINQVNYDVIIEKVQSLVSKVNGAKVEFDDKRIVWHVTYGGKIIPVSILELSSANLFLLTSHGEGCLFIILDKDKNGSIINDSNSFQFIDFSTLLDSAASIKESIVKLATTFNQNYSIELETRFGKILSEMRKDADFEAWAKRFFEGMKANYNELVNFLNYLLLHQNTILNTKTILLGGPGTSDFLVIDLRQYLHDGLKPEKFGEAKKFLATRFDVNHYGKALVHSLEEDTLFIVSTNDIQKEVWGKLHDMKVKVGYYKHVLLDRDLILILINSLKLQNLLS